MEFKTYQNTHDTRRLYRVHPNGKVETSTSGSSWFKTDIKPSLVNHWRRSGTVRRVESEAPKVDELTMLTQEIERLQRWERNSTVAERIEQIPMHPAYSTAYERKACQTVKADVLEARGYGIWAGEAERGLERINSGLSLPAHMVARSTAVSVILSQMIAKRGKLLAARQIVS